MLALWLVLCASAVLVPAAPIGPPPLDAFVGEWQTVVTCDPEGSRTECVSEEGETTTDFWVCEHDFSCCFDNTTTTTPQCFVPTSGSPSGPGSRYRGNQAVPTVQNALGAAHASFVGELMGMSCLNFPPFAQACDVYSEWDGFHRNRAFPHNLTVDGVPAQSLPMKFQVYPYQLVRAANTTDVALTSTVRMPFLKAGMFVALDASRLANADEKDPVSFEVSLVTMLRRYDAPPNTWGWAHPFPHLSELSEFDVRTRSVSWASGTPCAAGCAAGDSATVVVVRDTKSTAVAVAAFSRSGPTPVIRYAPDEDGPDYRAAWTMPVSMATTSRAAGLVLAVGHNETEAIAQAVAWAGGFNKEFEQAKADWEAFWTSAFNPSREAASGTVPTTPTSLLSGSAPLLDAPTEPALEHMYYASVLSVLQQFRLTPRGDTTFVAISAVNSQTGTYLWDTSYVSGLLSLLHPASLHWMLEMFLKLDVHKFNSFDFLSMGGEGRWYAFDDYSLFLMLSNYITLGPKGLSALNETIIGKTGLEWLASSAQAWHNLPQVGKRPLADYGGVPNLLETVPTYQHGVAALNGANAWMMATVADVYDAWGIRKDDAAVLRKSAEEVSKAVMEELYVHGKGFWQCLYPNGTKVEVRTVIDTVHIAATMDMPPHIQKEILKFVEDELLTEGWMRALSLKDGAAHDSDRNDHGSDGSWDGWPAQVVETFARAGDYKMALSLFRRWIGVLKEGPLGQSHHVYGNSNRSARAPSKSGMLRGQDYNGLCGGNFADVIIRRLFGFSPSLTSSNSTLVDADTPRQFSGSLYHVRHGSRLYTIRSRQDGLVMEEE